MGPGIFSTLVLASAGGLGAAAFGVSGVLFGFADWVSIAGILAPNLFVVAAMLHDVRRKGRVHPVYLSGLAISVALEGAMLVSGMTAAGDPVRQGLAWVGRLAAPLY